MKEENITQKNSKEIQNQTEENKIFSQESNRKDSKINLSPDKNLMNQKFFPSKENYFGVKTSPKHMSDKSVSPGSQSPILNYYSNINSEKQDYYFSNNNNPNKLSPNFNYSPSTIFNAPNNNKDSNSFLFQNNINFEGEEKLCKKKWTY